MKILIIIHLSTVDQWLALKCRQRKQCHSHIKRFFKQKIRELNDRQLLTAHGTVQEPAVALTRPVDLEEIKKEVPSSPPSQQDDSDWKPDQNFKQEPDEVYLVKNPFYNPRGRVKHEV